MAKRIVLYSLLSWLLASNSAFAGQSNFSSTEEQFHDLFLTAGYSTAFGAALGAAFIGLSQEPEANLHYIAVGASIGFISGSMLGTYIMVAPSFTHAQAGGSSYELLSDNATTGQLQLRPLLAAEKLVGIGTAYTWQIP